MNTSSRLAADLSLATCPQPTWLGLDNWKTLFRATFPEPIREFQIICGYKADSSLQCPDAEFMYVCLTTCSDRVRNALREEKPRLVEEDPGEYIRLVERKLGFQAPSGAERELAKLVADERSGLSKFVDVPLKRFKERGLKLALVSNVWPFPMTQIFNEEEGGISQSDFDQLVLSYEVGHAKPTRQFYGETLRRCDTEAHKFLMVGDNPELDIRAALNCGMHAAQIDHYADCEAGRVATVPGVPVIAKLRELL
jgi:FMN phosphatase YigB (HAD superfamily)